LLDKLNPYIALEVKSGYYSLEKDGTGVCFLTVPERVLFATQSIPILIPHCCLSIWYSVSFIRDTTAGV
jgi:hypothetical protein